MHIVCRRDELVRAVTAAVGVVPTSTALEALRYLRLEADERGGAVFATDGEMSIHLRVGSETKVPGVASAPARLLAEYLKALRKDEHVEMEWHSKTRTLSVRAEGTEANLRGIDPDDLPVPLLSPEGGGTRIGLSAGLLSEAIARTAFIPDVKGVAHPALTGVLMEFERGKVTLAAADSYRLSTASLPCDADGEMALIVPVQALRRLNQMMGCAEQVMLRIPPAHNRCVFEIEGIGWLAAQTIDGKFPEYRALIPPACEHGIRVDAEMLLQAVRIAAPFGYDTYSKLAKVSLEAAEDEMWVIGQSEGAGEGKASVSAEVRGGGIHALFNARYLLDGIEAVGKGSMVIEANGPTAPHVFRPARDDGFVYVAMPMLKES